jgi:uncharacterized protein (TIGR03067 family)
MIRVATCLGLLALVLATGAARAGGEREEQLRLQGTWEMVALGTATAKAPPKNAGRKAEIIGNKLSLAPKTEWVLRLYPTRNPPEVDITIAEGKNRDKVMRGIYKLEGDTLTLYYGAVTSGQRPASFDDVQAKFLRMVLKRVPAEKKENP